MASPTSASLTEGGERVAKKSLAARTVVLGPKDWKRIAVGLH